MGVFVCVYVCTLTYLLSCFAYSLISFFHSNRSECLQLWHKLHHIHHSVQQSYTHFPSSYSRGCKIYTGKDVS